MTGSLLMGKCSTCRQQIFVSILLLPVLPALASDDRGEKARRDLNTVNIMAQCVSEFFPELSAFAVKIGLALGALVHPWSRGVPAARL